MEIDKILEFVGKIQKEKEECLRAEWTAQEVALRKPKHRSEEINELSTALAKAQSEMPTAGLNSENPYFKSSYADLSEIVRVSRPSLTKNGLSVTQQIITDDNGATMIHTVLMHSSGQWIETNMRVLPPKNDVQALGSYLTYLRRYSYGALVGVVVTDDSDDDDGERAVATSRETFAKGTALNAKYDPKKQSSEVITKEQLEELEYELSEYPDIAEQILEGFKLLSVADLPKEKYSASIRKVREIKLLRNGK
jgi:hypothetical protein